MDNAVREVEEHLTTWARKASLPLRPVSFEVSTFVDELDEETLFVGMVLPPPDGETWDTEQVRTLSRAVRTEAEPLLVRAGWPRPWGTVVGVVPGDDLPEEERPIDDPVEYEAWMDLQEAIEADEWWRHTDPYGSEAR